MKSECIDYRQLPGQNPLFLKYLYNFDQVSEFYGAPVHLNVDVLTDRAKELALGSSSYPREDLVEFLKGFNQRIGAGKETFRNLERLKSDHTLVVVTGQQPGLFGGPAFTVYKAITAIRLAQILEEKGHPTVPIFWLASDNSDFGEVESAGLLDSRGGLVEYKHPDLREDPSWMVGAVELSAIQGCFDELEEHPPKGEFREQLLTLLRETYPRSRNFGEALGSWLARLFEAQGLVLFDPLSPEYRRSAQPVFRAAIEKNAHIVEALKERSRLLESRGFSPQVRIDENETLMYRAEGQKRYRLQFGDTSDAVRSSLARPIGREQCLLELERQPGSFVPNVLLRPIVQDFLLPTVAYVGGASEVAYFAQVTSISPFWKQEMVVFPRLGLTVADGKAQRFLAKYDLKATDFFTLRPEELSNSILRRGDSGQVIERLERLQNHLGDELEKLRVELGKADPTVAEMVGGARKKIIYQTEKIQNRFLANKRQRDETLAQHLRYLYDRFYPKRQLQERSIGFGQFLSEEGPGFTQRLLEATDPFCLSHQIVYL